MFGRGKSEGKFGRSGQTFLPFAEGHHKTKRDRSLSWGKHDRCTQIRGVWGKSWVHDTIHRDRQGWLNGGNDRECHKTLSHPASARFPVYSLLRETPELVILGYCFASLDGVCMSLSNIWYDIWVKLSA